MYNAQQVLLSLVLLCLMLYNHSNCSQKKTISDSSKLSLCSFIHSLDFPASKAIALTSWRSLEDAVKSSLLNIKEKSYITVQSWDLEAEILILWMF